MMAAFMLMYAVLALSDISTAVTVNQFYPFGSDSGDTLLSERASSDPLQLPFELPVLTTTTTSYEVLFEGSIVFPQLIITPLRITLEPRTVVNNIEAAIWGGYSNDSTLLSRARCDVAAQFRSDCDGNLNFNPTHLIKVTTINYTESAQPPGNSFQIVIASDGTLSFVIMLFGEVNFAPSAASYSAKISKDSTTYWTAPYSTNITQAPILMQHSYTPGIYILNLITFSPPQASCDNNLIRAACSALRIRGEHVPERCSSSEQTCVP